jgi:hypothetical protein
MEATDARNARYFAPRVSLRRMGPIQVTQVTQMTQMIQMIQISLEMHQEHQAVAY